MAIIDKMDVDNPIKPRMDLQELESSIKQVQAATLKSFFEQRSTELPVLRYWKLPPTRLLRARRPSRAPTYHRRVRKASTGSVIYHPARLRLPRRIRSQLTSTRVLTAAVRPSIFRTLYQHRPPRMIIAPSRALAGERAWRRALRWLPRKPMSSRNQAPTPNPRRNRRRCRHKVDLSGAARRQHVPRRPTGAGGEQHCYEPKSSTQRDGYADSADRA